MGDRLKIGDLVEWLESIYPKVHKINRGIIIRKNGAMEDLELYKVVTIDNEAVWVYGTDLRKLEEEC
ncbi:MAG: hypothetical protein CMQ41_12540 [Gammaproteobacteria bacterium]|nr:hypothetical protein [Gammaproteobacteria bacterium]|tara:strand:- start:297 stop:497 length:201 start_codon:yes stop_codon:yes gene_type:complete